MFDNEDDDISLVERAGDISLINEGDAHERLFETINEHTELLRAVAGDAAQRDDLIRRMVPDAQEALREAKASARAVYTPGGNLALFEARYLDDNDVPQMGRHTVQVPTPGGMEQERRHGILTEPNPVTREQQDAQRAYDGLVLAIMRTRAMRLTGAARWQDPLVMRSWMVLRKTLRSLPGKTGEFFKRKLDDADYLRSVLDGSTGSGGELIPDPELAGLRRPTDLIRRVPGLVSVMPAPSRSFHPITVSGRILGKKRRVTGANPSRFPHTKFSTAKSTITVVDQVYMALMDSLFTADAAQMLGDPMGFVMRWLNEGRMDTLEIAMLHGDASGDIADVEGTWTLGGVYDAGALSGSDSPLGWWQGWRARAAADGNTLSAGGSFDMTDHFGALELLGNLHGGAVAITGLHALYTQILGNSIFTTWDKMGPQATQITGTMGNLAGTPLVISEFMTDEFDSTNGVYTGSNASSAMLYVAANRYNLYDLAAGAGDFRAEYPDMGAEYTGVVDRSILDFDGISGEKPAALLYSL